MTVKEQKDLIYTWARVVFSLLFFIAGCVMLSSDNNGTRDLGVGFLGTVIGFWLR